jgi:hypothetical protein
MDDPPVNSPAGNSMVIIAGEGKMPRLTTVDPNNF